MITIYADKNFYEELYGEIAELTYNRVAWKAGKLLDKYTTGIDGVCKLRVAFPSDLDAAEAVKRCECAVINLLVAIEAATASGATTTKDGVAVSGPVTSVSSGAESISYAAAPATAITAAASDFSTREKLIASTIRNYLCGEKDANGVNLLYMGVYPYVL